MGNAFCFFSVLILIVLFVFLLWRNSQESPTQTPEQTDQIAHHISITYSIEEPRPPKRPTFIKQPSSTFVDYWQIKEPMAELKRKGDYDSALKLILATIEAVERANPIHLPPWPYEQAAIVYRKQKRYEEEIQILESYFERTNVYPKGQAAKLAQRLPKTYQLAGRALNPNQLIRYGLGVDLETTGLYERDEIIEFAAVLFTYSLLTGEILEVVTEYSGFREPKRPIPKSATRVHGLQDSDVKGHYLDEGNIKALWKRAHVIVAHNASFEEKFINSLYPWTNKSFWLCSMNGVNWQRKGHKSRSLQNLIRDCNIVDGSAHRALADVHHMLSLLKLHDQDGRQFFSELLTID